MNEEILEQILEELRKISQILEEKKEQAADTIKLNVDFNN